METIRKDSKTTARVGILGCGNIGSLWDESSSALDEAKTHAKAFSGNKACQIVSFLDADLHRAQAAAQFWKAPHSTNILAEFIKQDLDILSLCTPESARLSLLQEIPAKKGMVLICEKPLGTSAQEAEAVVKLCQEKGWLLVVNFVRSFGQGFQELHQLVSSQELGTLEKIVSHYGKGLRNNGSHLLQLILQIGGQPKAAKSLKVFADDRANSDDPTHDVQIDFKDGFSAYMTANDHRHFTVFELSLFFSGGRVDLTARGNKIQVSKVINDPQYLGYKILKKDRELSPGLKNHFQNLVNDSLKMWKSGSAEPQQTQSVLLTHQIIDEISKRGTYGI